MQANRTLIVISNVGYLKRVQIPLMFSQLEAAFKGVDTLISTLVYSEIDSQFKVVDAAKLAGVKRFVPDDWGTACVRGVRKLYDQVRHSPETPLRN